jgi:hypothetical protein
MRSACVSRPSWRTLLSTLLGLLALAQGRPAPARAEGPSVWRELVVAMPPVFDTFLLEGAPFQAPTGAADDPQRGLARRRAQLARVVGQEVARLDLVRFLSEEALRQTLLADPAIEGQARLAGERLDLGRERWLGLESEAALDQFDRARASMRLAFIDLLVPERFADVEFQRGLAFAELGREPDAIEAFRAMFVHDPARRFAAGWYGPRVDRLLEAAAEDVRRTTEPMRARYPLERLRELADRVGARSWLLGVIRETSEGGRELVAELVTFSAANPQGLARAGLFALDPTPGPVTLAVPAAFDRWLTAWHTCALELEDDGVGWRPPRQRRFFLDLSFRALAWLTHRQTRDLLRGPGFELGLSWAASDLFELWARLGQSTTLVDERGDLLNEFGTTHIGVGGALRFGSEAFTLSVRVGLDAAISLNDFEATYDIDCKFFGPDHSRCGRIFVARAPLGWFGLDAGLNLRWRPHPSWYLGLSAGISVYLVDLKAVRELNHPLHLSLGVGAAF